MSNVVVSAHQQLVTSHVQTPSPAATARSFVPHLYILETFIRPSTSAMLSRAGLRSIRTVPRAAAPLTLAPRAPPSQALARRSVGGVSERESGSKVPRDVVPLISAVGFALLLGGIVLLGKFKKDPTLRTHREDAVDREPTDPPPPAPEWDKAPKNGGRLSK